MSMEYIRRTYGVPAKRGMRVVIDGKPGRIVSSMGGYLRVRLDGELRPSNYHPTWRVEYPKTP